MLWESTLPKLPKRVHVDNEPETLSASHITVVHQIFNNLGGVLNEDMPPSFETHDVPYSDYGTEARALDDDVRFSTTSGCCDTAPRI